MATKNENKSVQTLLDGLTDEQIAEALSARRAAKFGPALQKLNEATQDPALSEWNPPTLQDRIAEVIKAATAPLTMTEILESLSGKFVVSRISKFPLRNTVKRYSTASKVVKAGKAEALWTEKDGKFSAVKA
jgi:hypothetical protein